jgi:hypothetical protein
VQARDVRKAPRDFNSRPAPRLATADLYQRSVACLTMSRPSAKLIPGPDFAESLMKCEERIRGAIMHLASETMSESLAEADRSGGRHAVSALWMEAIARGEAETAAALSELWTI